MDLITPSSGLLFWMTLVFAIVFFVLAKFGFPAITASLKKRKDYIENSLEDARKAGEELAGMQETCRQLLAQARIQQDELLTEARKTAAGIVEASKADARKEAAAILEDAKAQIEQEKRAAVSELSSVVANLAVAVSEKVLRQQLTDEGKQIALSEKLLEEIKQAKHN